MRKEIDWFKKSGSEAVIFVPARVLVQGYRYVKVTSYEV